MFNKMCSTSLPVLKATSSLAPYPGRDLSPVQSAHHRAASLASLYSTTTAATSLCTADPPLEATLVVIDLSETRNLGITVVGQSSQEGDLGIFVGSLKPGGAAERSGKVTEGDWILEVGLSK